ncbi:sensor c-di-GMP phosphodiesterase, contains CSS-motif sensor and EAL domain [Roseibium denhamense]|uniref:cyclic-guanylate-specific phosphodiesterase n=2 Tax=Roseibium denhamense TaxID=76305 RepID=A0ABY1PLQ6_9HYPH|nr:sensor c-di-GMP phosphodiesterase, contains CSS-motif sensor and EAL domain [Roseibium denhamense]
MALMMLVAWTVISVQGKATLKSQTTELLNKWVQSLEDGDRLYAQLESIRPADCGPDHLRRLNTIVFHENSISNIWYFGAETTHAQCSSVFGAFDPPIDLGDPTRGLFSTDDRVTWYNRPISAIEGLYTLTVVKKGSYGVSFTRTGNLAVAEDDQFYVADPGDPDKIRSQASGNPDLLTAYKNDFGPMVGNIYARACSDGSISLCYLTMISSVTVLWENKWPLTIFFLFSCITGFLVSQRVNRIVHKMRSPAGRIRRAVARGGAGFVPYYQPIMTLEAMECQGCEVLARFEDEYGKLYPDQFIATIQELGLTWEFTEIIIKKALKDLSPLLAGRPGFKVAVNFFQADLEDDRIQTVIGSPVFKLAADAKISLSCEILETGIRAGTSIAKSLEYLRSIGCSIAIDDFGTGYSNLAQVKALKPDLIKIDKMFIDDLTHNSDTARSAFINVILDLASAQGISVCAEGIETMEQLAALRNRSVDFGQGYFFAKPMPIQDFSLYLLEKAMKRRIPETERLGKLFPLVR